MEDGDGKLELLPNKLWDEGSKVKRPTQPVVMCESPSLTTRSVRLPLVDLSNTLDSPMCTSIPSKPSWTYINRSFSELEEKLEVSIGKKRVSPPKKNQQDAAKKIKLNSQTDKENAVILVEAGAQPRQEL